MIHLDDLSCGKGSQGKPLSSIVWFSADCHMMRREALWEKLILSEADCKALESAQLFAVSDGECKPIYDANIKRKFLDYYPRYLEDNYVLPVLCLIELSPKAANRFIEGEKNGSSEHFGLLVNYDRMGSFGVKLDELLMDALTDVMNQNTIYYFEEHRVEHQCNKTYLYRIGDMMLNGSRFPALLTFRVNPGRYISMYHSIPPYESGDGSITNYPIVLDSFDIEFHKSPTGIPNGVPSYTYLGENWITPLWFHDLFVEYSDSHNNLINDSFVTLLKEWVLIDLSNNLSIR